MGKMKLRIERIKADIEKRISEECEEIKKSASQEEAVNKYYRNIRWTDPELAEYIKKKMLVILNLND